MNHCGLFYGSFTIFKTKYLLDALYIKNIGQVIVWSTIAKAKNNKQVRSKESLIF